MALKHPTKGRLLSSADPVKDGQERGVISERVYPRLREPHEAKKGQNQRGCGLVTHSKAEGTGTETMGSRKPGKQPWVGEGAGDLCSPT